MQVLVSPLAVKSAIRISTEVTSLYIKAVISVQLLEDFKQNIVVTIYNDGITHILKKLYVTETCPYLLLMIKCYDRCEITE